MSLPTAPVTQSPLEADLRALHDQRWPARTAVDRVCDYALWPAGKLLRPALVLAACAVVGGDAEPALPAALSLEYLHVASLVHDDIVDGAQQRRGRPSVAARFGRATALLAGDQLVFQAMRACAESARRGISARRALAAVEAVAGAGETLCAGQSREQELLGALDAGLDDYVSVAVAKTASLLGASCRVGALVGGATVEQERALVGFAGHLGVVYQMLDDLRPYSVSDPYGLADGKDVLADVAGQRMTFPLVVAREALGAPARSRLAEAFDPRVEAPEAWRMLAEIVHDDAVTARIRGLIGERLDAMEAELLVLPAGPARSNLARLGHELTASAGDDLPVAASV